jgi:hypothetical protein
MKSRPKPTSLPKGGYPSRPISASMSETQLAEECHVLLMCKTRYGHLLPSPCTVLVCHVPSQATAARMPSVVPVRSRRHHAAGGSSRTSMGNFPTGT